MATWSSKLLTKFGQELDERELLGQAYEWFVEENGGLTGAIYSYGQHKSDVI